MVDQLTPGFLKDAQATWQRWEDARKHTLEQAEALRTAVQRSETTAKEITVETAVLNALSNRELSSSITLASVQRHVSLELITDRVTDATQRLTAQLNVLQGRVDTFTTKADEGTRLLARWTLVLAVGTFLLFLATIGLVFATWRLK